MSRYFAWILCLCLAVIAIAGILLHRHPNSSLGNAAKSHSIASVTRAGANSKQAANPHLTRAFEHLPLSFEQRSWDKTAGTKFFSSGPGFSLGITKDGASLVRKFPLNPDSLGAINPVAMFAGAAPMGASDLQLSWIGANPVSEPVGEAKQKSVSNYFPTSDPKTWHRRVPHYSSVRVPDLYPGTDLRFHGDHQALEFDYLLKPGADASRIRIGIGTPSILSLSDNGELKIFENGDALILEPPVAYQEIRGKRENVNVKYVLAQNHEVQFQVGAYDKSAPLVIDPVLSFSASFGPNSDQSIVSDISVDSAGNIYLTGSSCDVNYPVTPGALQTSGGSIANRFCNTGIITEMDPTASSLLYSTYIGSQDNVTSGIRILPVSGGALVAGVTTATDFPTTANAYQKTAGGGTCTYGPFLKNFPCTDGFLMELNSDGSQIVFATYLGGNAADLVSAMTLDSSGNIYIGGATNSTNFPVTAGTVGATYGGGMCQGGLYPCFDGFVAKMNSNGSQLLLATYLGGDDDDFASGVAVDASGNIYVGGTAYSTNFPTTAGSFQPNHSAGADQGDAFVSKLTADMKTLSYSTYVGGTGFDIGLGLKVDSTGAAYIFGSTDSSDFPTTAGSFQTTYAGPPAANTTCDTALDASLLDQPSCGDIFVSKLNPAGSALVYSTYIGGSGQDIAFNAGLDSTNNMWLLADTNSTDFPYTSDAYYTSTSSNVALMELSADGTSLTFATPLAEGNAGQALGLGLTIDSSDDVYAAGQATQFMGTPGSYSSGGPGSVFVAKYVQGTARPGVTLSATSITFPQLTIPTGSSTQPQQVTLTNSGTAPLILQISLNQATPGSPVPFTEYDNCGTTVAMGASCTINVVYQPVNPASTGDGGIVTIIDNAPNAPHTISLSGSSGTIDSASFVPPTLTFTGQGPGTTSASQSTGLNTPASGTNALLPITAGAPTVSGPNSSEFAVDASNCPLSTHECSLSVTFTPAVSATGTRTATISVPTNAPNSPQTVSLTGTVSTGPHAAFPNGVFINSTAVGVQTNTTFVVVNTGGATLNVTGETITGANAGDFSLSAVTCSLPAFSLPPGQSCGIGLGFKPSANGTRTATFTLTDNETSPGSLPLSGFGTDPNDPAFQLLITPNAVNGTILFPDSVVGTTGTFTYLVTLLNEGQGSTGSVTSTTISTDYSQTNTCSGTIPYQGSCTYTVSFSPKQAGARPGTLTIVTNGPGPQTFNVPLSGNGVLVPQVSFTPPTVNFGDQASGTTSAAQTVTLKNTGNGALNISNVAVSTPFSQTSTCGATVAAGATCTFAVKFAPTSTIPFGGTLSFTGNAAGSFFSVGLNGNGVTGAVPVLTPQSLVFGNQAVGTLSAAQAVTLSNPGTTSFTYGGLQASENYQASSNCPATIAAGASCTISVKFAPGSDTITGGFPANGIVTVAVGAKGSPLTIVTTGTPTPSTGVATNLTISSSLNPSTSGQAVTFTATATPVTPGATPTGTVSFLDGGNPLGSAVTLNTHGVGTFTTSSLAAGNHSINFTYSGDATYAPETSSGILQTVNASGKAATTTRVTSSLNPATSGQNVTFTASLHSNSAGTITGTVTFFDGTTQLGTPVTVVSGAASFSTTTLSQGLHTITAQYSGDSNFASSTSPALTQTINAAGTVTTSTVVTSSLNPSTTGASVAFTATVTSSTPGTITGTVTFLDGATSLGTGMLNAGTATFSTTALTQGSHTITAQYGGNSTFKASTSPAITQTVNAAPDFSVAVSPTSLTLAAGNSGMVAVTITPVNGSTQTVTLGCSGLPRAAACSAPSVVTLDGTHPATSQLTFTTTTRGATPGPPPIAPPGTATRMLAVLGLCFTGVFVLSLLRTRNTAWRVAFATCVLAVPLTVLVACAGNPGNSTGSGTPAGTYTVTVSASSGTDIHSTPVTLSVQ